VGLLFSLIRLVVKRTINNLNLVAFTIAGLIVAVSLVASVPLYSDAIIEKLLRLRLDQPTQSNRPPGAMRVLTSVEATTKYSVQSGTPPTPRESTDAWAKKVAERINEPLDKVKVLLSSGLEAGRTQESPDHLFLQHPKISDTYDNQMAALWNHPEATAAGVMPEIAKVMDQTVLDIYNQFKDSMPKE